jgi:hypothetical protein
MSTNSYSGKDFGVLFNRIRLQRGLAFGIIILSALIAFELFNYSTTEYALTDLLGNLSFLGISWATILAIAFCGIDFAGIARLHTPEAGYGQAGETWYLFGAWLLAATMNAMLTWWGVSLAIVNNSSIGNSVIDQQTLIRVVPIFVAVLVWLIRVLIIGTYSLAGNRLLTQRDFRSPGTNKGYNNAKSLPQNSGRSLGMPANGNTINASPYRSANGQGNSTYSNTSARQDPTYTTVQTASPARNNNSGAGNYNNSNPYSQKQGPVRRN